MENILSCKIKAWIVQMWAETGTLKKQIFPSVICVSASVIKRTRCTVDAERKVRSKLNIHTVILNWAPWFSSLSSWTNHLSPRRELFKEIASVTMVITGNSRLFMPNMPITSWYVTPSLSYPDYSFSLVVLLSHFPTRPRLLVVSLICVSIFKTLKRRDWNWTWGMDDRVYLSDRK